MTDIRAEIEEYVKQLIVDTSKYVQTVYKEPNDKKLQREGVALAEIAIKKLEALLEKKVREAVEACDEKWINALELSSKNTLEMIEQLKDSKGRDDG